ncbi:GNAT family N-acetyltransferase [Candidatus Viridilinea mediisalina]|uniref:GNAT family N-acetyltransferase n=1 Tax=Candidatus Viridilinea mediisalina TaxID=2024553 RepID=A0A2A6RPF9_9CHLR|nr:GNAT family N-acetyltransferase [Candidatus Viridilinea mediisalina]PDW04833.1 GNAT family N-acetyltransferase [Candidatus Viridilinea mediisalina]
MLTQNTTYYLEMCDPTALRPVAAPAGFRVVRAELPCPELNRFLYTAVGGNWYWLDRLGWNYARWQAYLERPELETWVGYVAGTPAGYVELEWQARAMVEIAYFGLLPAFIGRRLGGALLTAALERAWAMGAERIWVHTCSLDGPAALANYQARGMRIFKTEAASIELPDQPPGPWPGA